MLIKNSESRGNILKIKHKLDIFNEISRFLFTFQSVPHMPRIFNFIIFKRSKSIKNYFFYIHLFEQKSAFFWKILKKDPFLPKRI